MSGARDMIRQTWKLQEARFLVVGGFNTLSGYGLSALIYWLLADRLPLLAVMVVMAIVNVTVSYVTQKFLVFRTQGNYIIEYLRFYAVSAVPIAIGFVLLPIAIEWLHMNAYLAMAAITGISVVISYLGHKHISFRRA